MNRSFFFLSVIILLSSCNNDNEYSYAIKDFRKSLQPHLFKIVSEGIVMHTDSALKNMATDDELVRLSHSEHPVLRASAFREMLERKSFDQYKLISGHLNDTAMVLSDRGEFGTAYRMVTDDILLSTYWTSRETRHKIIEKIIREHNYLTAAYTILDNLEPQENLYPFIKDMATRSRRLSYEGYELGFDDIEYALYGLAKFKRKDDVRIIRDQLLKNFGNISYVSLKLIEEYPDAAYFEILQEYHDHIFYKYSGASRLGFSGNHTASADPEDFIRAVVMQKSVNSARLLDTMLKRLPRRICMPGNKQILDILVTEIWQNPCPEYIDLRVRIRPEAEKLIKGEMPFEPIHNWDTTGAVISWYN